MADETTTTILEAAGFSAKQYGTEVAIDADARSVMLPRCRRYVIPPGEALYIPKFPTRTVTERARDATITDISFDAVSGNKAEMTKKFGYNAIQLDKPAFNDMTGSQFVALIDAYKTNAGAALATKRDTNILGLHGSVTTNVIGGAGVDVDADLLKEALKLLDAENAPRPWYFVMASSQFDHLAGITELTHANIRGDGGALVRGNFPPFFGADIVTTANVQTSGGIAKNLLFSGEAFAITLRDEMEVDDWYDPNTQSRRLSVSTDYAYALVREEWAVRVETTDG